MIKNNRGLTPTKARKRRRVTNVERSSLIPHNFVMVYHYISASQGLRNMVKSPIE
jgi:hypothetical protein